MGTDGKFLLDQDEQVNYVALVEKLFVPMLVKFSNFIPEAGIWMNTQRPEWNDANNALVGNGASMVTLYYLRRYTTFMQKLFQEIGRINFLFLKRFTNCLMISQSHWTFLMVWSMDQFLRLTEESSQMFYLQQVRIIEQVYTITDFPEIKLISPQKI